MASAKKSKIRSTSHLPPLPPESAGVLQGQVGAVAAACEAGAELESLKNLVTVNPRDVLWDLHLLTELANLRHQAIPSLLAELFGAAGDKDRRKALKRALHLLKTRGVPVPPELLPREEAALSQTRPVVTQAQVSAVLGNGDCVVILEAPKEVLGGNLLLSVLNDAAGFRECQVFNLKSRQQEEFWQYFRQQGLTDWFPVPGPEAVRRLEEAYRQTPPAVEAWQVYHSLRERIWQHWGRPDAAPDLEQAAPLVAPGERRRLLEQSGQLATSALFFTWLPGLEEMAPWLEKLRELEASPLVLSDQQKAVRADGLLEEAVRALYPLENRPLWGRRLLALAYCLDQAQRREEAKMVRAAADDLLQPEDSALAGENPFLLSLVRMGLSLAWQASQQPEETPAAGGLLTLPGDSPLIRR